MTVEEQCNLLGTDNHGWTLEKVIGKALSYYRSDAGFGHGRLISAIKRLEVEG